MKQALLNQTIIFNPAYFLRNDIHRAIIGTFEFPLVNKALFDAHFLHRIHPVIAQLLSFFCLPQKVSSAIEKIRNFFSLGEDEVLSILAPMVDNEESIINVFGGSQMVLPKNVLVSYDKVGDRDPREIYMTDDFSIYGPIDLVSVRLYRPIQMILELTMSCYANCEYCYADRNGHQKPMSQDLALCIIDQAHSMGFTDIEINGGEVMMHPGIWPILERLHSYGYSPLISTKIPLKEDVLLQLKKLNINKVQISLDSLNPSIEESLLNVKENYLERLVHTMDLLDFFKFDWQINTVLTKLNCTEDIISHLLRTVLTKYHHLKSIKLAPMGFPMYKSNDTFNRLAPDLSRIRAVQQLSLGLRFLNPNVELILQEPDVESDYLDKTWSTYCGRKNCTANQKAFNVLPDGKVTICEELYWTPAFIIGDLTITSIEEIWNSEKAKSLFYLDQRIVSESSPCKVCKQFINCRHNKQVCWKMVIMAFGSDNWDYPDPKCPNAAIPSYQFYYKH